MNVLVTDNVLLTTTDIAARLGIHYLTICKWERNGLQPDHQTEGSRQRLYSAKTVEAFLRRHRMDDYLRRWRKADG